MVFTLLVEIWCYIPFNMTFIYFTLTNNIQKNIFDFFLVVMFFFYPLSRSLLKLHSAVFCGFHFLVQNYSCNFVLLFKFSLTTTEKKIFIDLMFYLHVNSPVCVFSEYEYTECVCTLLCEFYKISAQVLIALASICACTQVSVHLSFCFWHSHPLPPPLYYLLPWLQGSPGFCTPGPTPPPDPQRSGEHTPSQGHAHHHQVKA